MLKFKNKNVLVTGGSRGIGKAIVMRLAVEGATVAFTYLNSVEKAKALVTELENKGSKAVAIRADTGKLDEVTAAVKLVVLEFGKIDILVNNAGVFITGAIDDSTLDTAAFERQWMVNVLGVAHTVRTALPYMSEGSRIISIGSTAAGRAPYKGISDYAATKAALAAYTRGWARDLGARNITANIIQPGLTNTDMNPSDGPLSQMKLPAVALGRFGEPKDIAAAVAFLASEDAQYITGATINVDGGQSA